MRNLAALLLAIVLSGCVHGGPKPLTDAETDAVLTGDQALISIDSGKWLLEDGSASIATRPVLTVGLVHLESKDVVVLQTSTTDVGRSGRSGYAVVEPGTYVLAKGFAETVTLEPELPLLQWWFDPFEVKGGEVVDLGVLEATVLEQIKRTDNIARQTARWLFDTREHRYYLTYHFAEEPSARFRDRLVEERPDLADRLEHRPPRQAIDEAAFIAIVKEAYARKPDGTWPTKEESEEAIAQRVKALLLAGLEDESV